MPPSASSNLPLLVSFAPVKEPFSWPKSSLAIKLLGEGGEIDRDERAVPPVAQAVDGLGDQLFPDPCLSEDEYRAVRRGNLLYLVDDRPHLTRFSDDHGGRADESHFPFVEDRLFFETVPLVPQLLVDPDVGQTDGYLAAEHPQKGGLVRRKGLVADPPLEAKVPHYLVTQLGGHTEDRVAAVVLCRLCPNPTRLGQNKLGALAYSAGHELPDLSEFLRVEQGRVEIPCGEYP